MDSLLEYAKTLFPLENDACVPLSEHEGGRNLLYACRLNRENRFVLRLSALGDRTEEDYLAETEFVHFLALHGAPVADVIPSLAGKNVERAEWEGKTVYLSLFAYAKGMLIADNGYRYREGAPLEEYFFRTGKALGAIHRLSKEFSPVHRRVDYFDMFSRASIDRRIPDAFAPLKQAMFRRLDAFRALPRDESCYGLVHFDFSDGNYHVDLDTGHITVFDFDNCMYCWYLYDLANLWLHGVGWCRGEQDLSRRKAIMAWYFNATLAGYRSETDVPQALLQRLPLFIDMVLMENIVDAFDCCTREGEAIDEEDIAHAARCLTENIPYAGIVPPEYRPQ